MAVGRPAVTLSHASEAASIFEKTLGPGCPRSVEGGNYVLELKRLERRVVKITRALPFVPARH